MSIVVDPLNDNEVDLLDDEKIQCGYDRHEVNIGKTSLVAFECTRDQLTAYMSLSVAMVRLSLTLDCGAIRFELSAKREAVRAL